MTCAPLGRVRNGAVPVPPGASVAVIFFIWNSLRVDAVVSNSLDETPSIEQA